MASPASGVRSKHLDPTMDQLCLQTQNMSLQTKGAKSTPAKGTQNANAKSAKVPKSDALVEKAADSVIKSLQKMFMNEITECNTKLHNKEVLTGAVKKFGVQLENDQAISVYFFRADVLLNTYVPKDLTKEFTNLSPKDLEICNSIYKLTTTKLWPAPFTTLRQYLIACESLSMENFHQSQLLKSMCIHAAKEVAKKL